MRRFCCTVIAAVLASLACATVCPGEEDSPNESARELMAAAPPTLPDRAWEAAVEGIWLPQQESADAGGKIGMSEAKVKLSRTFRATEALSFTPELAYSVLDVSAPERARLPETLHSISAGLRSDFRVNRRLSANILIAPGIAGDFRAVGGDDLRVRFGSTLRYHASDRLTLLGGLVYQLGYKSSRAIPVVGAIYRPTDQWTISIAAPRPGVSYAPDKELRFHLGAEMSGGEFELHERRVGAKVVRYRDFRLVAGAELAISAAVKAELATGYAFSRKFTFYEVFDATRGNLAVDPGPFVRAGARIAW